MVQLSGLTELWPVLGIGRPPGSLVNGESGCVLRVQQLVVRITPLDQLLTVIILV